MTQVQVIYQTFNIRNIRLTIDGVSVRLFKTTKLVMVQIEIK